MVFKKGKGMVHKQANIFHTLSPVILILYIKHWFVKQYPSVELLSNDKVVCFILCVYHLLDFVVLNEHDILSL